jgi:signal transduction histidine kinase
VTVTVSVAPDSVWLEVRDNGRGFELGNGQASGLGLNSLRERMAKLGGQLAIESAPGGGAVVRAQLALEGDGRHDG